MYSIEIAAASLACSAGGIALGAGLRRVIPDSHLRRDSKEGIQLGTGLVATMAALVLGLLIGGAKSSFDARRAGLQQLATNVILLDRTLAHYGNDAHLARAKLRIAVTSMIDHIRPPDGSPRPGLSDASLTAEGGALFAAVRNLAPADQGHRGAQAHALEIISELAKTRWELAQRDDDSLPLALLVVLMFWFLAIFTSLGAFWAKNATVVVVFLVCAISVATAMFLIVDMDQPFDGVIRVSTGSLSDALALLGT